MTSSLGSILAEGILSLEQLADALWLTRHLPVGVALHSAAAGPPVPPPAGAAATAPDDRAQSLDASSAASEHDVSGPSATEQRHGDRIDVVTPIARPDAPGRGLRFWSPGAPPLPGRASLARALRPVGWTVPHPDRRRIVEDETADYIASTRLWIPVTEPEREPAVDLVFVVDRDPRLRPWRELTRAFVAVVRSSGQLRNVTIWTIDGHAPSPRLRPGGAGQPRGPRQLLDPTGRSVVLVVSDFAGALWREGEGLACLQLWGRRMSTTLVSLLPERLWDRTVLGELSAVALFAEHRGQASAFLCCETPADARSVTLPVITIDAISLGAWAALIAGDARVHVPGVAVPPDPSPETRAAAKARAVLRGRGILDPAPAELATLTGELSAHLAELAPATDTEAQLERFRRSAPSVVQLGAALACAPLRLDVMRLVQRALIPSSGPLELAEVLGSGLFSLRADSGVRDDSVWFEVAPGVRRRLADLGPKRDSVSVLELVGRFIRDQLSGAYDFEALMLDPDHKTEAPPDELRPFAELYIDELERLGGRYREQARRLREATPRPSSSTLEGDAAAPPFRDIWILVVGDSPLARRKQPFAEAIGAALARAGYGLVTCGYPGVDEVAARAFLNALDSDTIEARRLAEERLIQVVQQTRSAESMSGTIVRVSRPAAEYSVAISRSLAMIVVGGQRWIRRAVERAMAQGVPVLLCPNTGGVASELLSAQGVETGADRTPAELARSLIANLDTFSGDADYYHLLAAQYEAIRRNYKPGTERTGLMQRLVDRATERSRRFPEPGVLINGLHGLARDGTRVIALACCVGAPGAAPIHVIADAISSPRSPFEQWVALGAALAVVDAVSPLGSEPCVVAALAQLDAKDSLLNTPDDQSRLVLAVALVNGFARRLGLSSTETEPERIVRRWIDAGSVRGDSRRAAVFGSDLERRNTALCQRLGERLARHGWKLSAGYGANAGPEVVDGFVAAGGAQQDVSLLFSGDHGGIESTARLLLQDAEAVILIGGGPTTHAEYNIACAAGIPAIGISFTGGTAERVSGELQERLIEDGVPVELLRMLEVPRDPEVGAEAVVRTLNMLAARERQATSFALWDTDEIRHWLVDSGHCRGDEIIEVLNIFATRTQRTWLVFLPQRVLCLLDDSRTRAKDSLLQFSSEPAQLRPVNTEPMSPARSGARSTRVLTMGARRRWLYSVRLFPDPGALIGHVMHVLDAAESARPEVPLARRRTGARAGQLVNLLFLPVTPSDQSWRVLRRYVEDLRYQLREAGYGDVFRFEQHSNVTVDRLAAYVLQYRPQIIHFEGHGEETEALVIPDSGDAALVIQSDALARVFAVLHGLRCIVLSRCYSRPLADVLRRSVDIVIGMSHAIPDDEALGFAKAFYVALAEGKNIQVAFVHGCSVIAIARAQGRGALRDVTLPGEPPFLEPDGSTQMPELLVRDGVDATTVYFTEPATRLRT
jgi:hypothetical protein